MFEYLLAYMLIFSFLMILSLTIKKIRNKGERYPIDNIGILIIVVIGLYSIIPSIGYLLLGDGFSVFTMRISNMPQIGEVLYLLTISNSFALGLYFAYKFKKKSFTNIFKQEIVFIDKSILYSAIFLFVFVSIASTFLNIKYNLNNPSSYINSYSEIANLPLTVRQFLAFQRGWISFLKVILILGLFQRWPKSWYMLLLILLPDFLTYSVEGSRTGIVISLFIVFILWHIIIQPLSKKKILIGGTVFLVGFSLLGLLRGGDSLESIAATSVLNVSEFTEIWLNSVQIFQESNSGSLSIPLTVHLNDLLAFIPSTFLPWEKMDFSTWYASTYYPEYYKAGGGMAFGLASQIVSGFGIPEAFIRGLLWGKVSIFLINWVKTSKKWWVFPVYLSLFLYSYQVARYSCFELITGSVLKYALFITSVIIIRDILINQKKKVSNLSNLQ